MASFFYIDIVNWGFNFVLIILSNLRLLLFDSVLNCYTKNTIIKLDKE